MEASTKSFHAWLYRFTYSSDLPGNLCPYFWKLVWAAIIFIPTCIIRLPVTVIDAWSKGVKPFENERGPARSVLGLLLYCIIAIFLTYLFITYQWIRAMFGAYEYNYGAANGGLTANIIIIGVFLGVYIDGKLKKIRKDRIAAGYKPKPNIVREFIKATYNNYCPKIEWDSETKTNT